MKTNDQLIKKAKETGNYQNIYPIAYIDGIIDKESNEKLSDILIRYNHILVPWQGSVVATRNRVTLLMRRQGLWITYLNEDSEIVTEVYKGSAKDIITNWADDINWEIIPDMEYVQNNASKIPDGAILPQHLSKELQEMLLSSGKVTNLPDNEDLTTQGIALKFKDREYNPEQASGKGYKILRKNWTIVDNNNINLLTQEMINDIKTVYEIRYDFNLNGQTINIPNGSILDFKGGSLNNGTINFPEGTYIRNLYKGTATITGNPTYIDYLADEEDVTTENGILKFKDKEYSSSDFSGLGRKYLRKNIVDDKNILTQEMINSANTRYIIQYDYDLNGQTITIPEGCVLDFQGGSFSNGVFLGTIKFNVYHKYVLFKHIKIKGNGVNNVYTSYFEGNDNDIITNCIKLSINASCTVDKDLTLSLEDGVLGTPFLIQNPTNIIILSNINIKPNNFSRYSIICIYNTKDVSITGKNCKILGDRDYHQYTEDNTHEWGFGIRIQESENININNVYISHCTGDGVIASKSKNVKIENSIIDYCRRQGITIGQSSNNLIHNCIISNIYGTNPSSAIDIEHDGGVDGINTVIDNCIATDCIMGISVGAVRERTGNVVINNYHIIINNNFETEENKGPLISLGHFSYNIVMENVIIDINTKIKRKVISIAWKGNNITINSCIINNNNEFEDIPIIINDCKDIYINKLISNSGYTEKVEHTFITGTKNENVFIQKCNCYGYVFGPKSSGSTNINLLNNCFNKTIIDARNCNGVLIKGNICNNAIVNGTYIINSKYINIESNNYNNFLGIATINISNVNNLRIINNIFERDWETGIPPHTVSVNESNYVQLENNNFNIKITNKFYNLTNNEYINISHVIYGTIAQIKSINLGSQYNNIIIDDNGKRYKFISPFVLNFDGTLATKVKYL